MNDAKEELYELCKELNQKSIYDLHRREWRMDEQTWNKIRSQLGWIEELERSLTK